MDTKLDLSQVEFFHKAVELHGMVTTKSTGFSMRMTKTDLP